MNKNLLSLIACMFVLSLSVNAQKTVIGLKGGLDFTKINGESFSNSYTGSFNVGAYLESRINDKWGWQTELVYNQGNEKINSVGLNTVYSGGASNLSVSTSATIGSISLPVLATYKLNNYFSLHAGPQVSVNAYTNENIFQNGTVAFKAVDFAACIGGKLDLNGVKFCLRYNHGLTNINNYDGRDKWLNRQINFGMEIPFFKLKK